ncbi:hypothetical protein [Methanoculleus sp. DTU007]|jgi:hypothetical protein|uniref:Uncharacterized protein n=1 Tax=Methanoculleus thermophilus TaxID=2200 RepID=A0A1G8XX45_9EURY|nr:hypothetical protein [Methanoculleus sp. DTU007]SDJ95093.1 hypothetical protein SAMN04488571_10295 [Methanoculleus thermophilus]
MSGKYVLGYTEREAATLIGLLHGDTRYPAGSRMLEAGCCTGYLDVHAHHGRSTRTTPGRGLLLHVLQGDREDVAGAMR